MVLSQNKEKLFRIIITMMGIVDKVRDYDLGIYQRNFPEVIHPRNESVISG